MLTDRMLFVYLLLIRSSTALGAASNCTDNKNMDCKTLDKLFDICEDIHDAKTVCRNFCNLCSLVDGNWAEWSSWSICDVTCGQGKYTRIRTCTDPAPANQGLDCEGNAIDTKPCVKPLCPVHGGWSDWSNWGSCPITCGIGIQKRFRNCSNPYPLRYGEHCFGNTVDMRICIGETCDDGAWTKWNSWGTCSLCNGGLRQRSRSCSKNRFSLFGKPCEGDSIQIQMCSRGKCLPLTSCSSKRNYNSSFTNVALRKKAKLSSVYLNFQGDLMVDSNLTSFMHTNLEANPYAMIDLGDTYLVYSIYIVNRKDCCPERLHDVIVQIGHDPSRLDIAARHKAAIGADCTLQFPKPYQGRYVKIQLEATEYLQIGEFEVYSVI